MSRKRNTYNEAFKRQAVRLTLDESRSVADVSRLIGVNESLLHRWKRQYGMDVLDEQEDSKDEQVADGNEFAILEYLQAELARLREERDTLKRAIAILSNS